MKDFLRSGDWFVPSIFFVAVCLIANAIRIESNPKHQQERARQAGYEAVKIHDAYEQGRQQALKENQSGHP